MNGEKRKVEHVEYSRIFLKSLSRLPPDVLKRAKEKEAIFRNNPFDSRLDTHKLHGKDREVWAFSISGSYRIKFIFLTGKSILFLEVGTHDIYK